VWILKKLGLIEMPTVNGKEVKVRATSPLAQAQNHQDILAIDRLAAFVGERFGPQLAGLFLKGDEIAEYVGKKLQVPERFVRNKAEMQDYTKMIQGLAQSMGAMPGATPQEPAVEGV
jgi:hypothetical protein